MKISFLSVLKTVGHGIVTATQVADKAAPLLEKLPGAYGPLAGTLLDTVVAVEKMVPASGAGAAKKSIAQTVIGVLAPEAVKAMPSGNAPVGSPSPPESLSGIIDDVVTGLNQVNTALGKLPGATA